ncbi:MAG TPA: hypothetical protein VMV05_05885 [bacterium]|nr:hypothetical protein [bacterium]
MFLSHRLKNFHNCGLRTANLKLVWLFTFFLFLEGCATYSQKMLPIRDSLLTGDVTLAVQNFKKIPASKDDLLHMLQEGYLDNLSGDWQSSNDAFDAAEKRYEELYTISISNEAFSLLTSDNSRPYRSNEQEMALIPYYRIFNYVQLGKYPDALVEARKANDKHKVDLSQLDKMSEKDIRFKAFLNYYTGLLFASQGESNDAMVSFRNAFKLYQWGNTHFGLPMPRWLPGDYYRTAINMDLKDEVRLLPKTYPDIASRAAQDQRQNLVLFLESGFVPYREGVDIFLPIYKTDKNDEAARYYRDTYSGNIYAYQTKPAKLDQFLRISFPKIAPFPSAVASCQLFLPNGTPLRSENGLDLARVTDLQFKQDLGDILLRTLIRTLAKQGTLKSAQDKSSGLGALVNIFNVATEQADTRSWLLLPERIDLVKTSVPAGTNQVTVRFLDSNGMVVEQKSVPLNPSAGGLQWISVRCFK